MDAGRVLPVVNGIELPFGYRFHPTAVEILEHYLVPKVKGQPLPSDYIRDFDVYQYDPDQLPLNESQHSREDEAYYFVPVTSELLEGVDNSTRATPNGYWKISHGHIHVYGSDGSFIGYKNKLEFYSLEDPTKAVKTDWKMVEYRTNYRLNGNIESCMVCKLRFKVKAEETYDEEDGDEYGDDGEAENNVLQTL